MFSIGNTNSRSAFLPPVSTSTDLRSALSYWGKSPLSQNSKKSIREAIDRICRAAENDYKVLNLCGLNLSSVPPEIGQLKCLAVLDLSDNRLKTLPAELG